MKKLYTAIEVFDGLVDCIGWACEYNEENAIRKFEEMDMAEEIVVIQVPESVIE